MAITFTASMPRVQRISRDLGLMLGTLTVSGAYTPGAGRLALPTTLTKYFLASTIYSMNFEKGPSALYDLEYDQSANKVKVFTDAPPVVAEEFLTTAGGTANSCTLKYPPAYINYVCGGASDYATPYYVICGAAGVANVKAAQAHVNMDTGVVTFAATAPVLVKVSYVTKAAKVFADNMVEDETITLESTGGVDLANLACCIQAVTDIEVAATPVAHKLITDGSDAVASGEAEIDWVSGSVTNITSEGTQDAEAGLCTYIKKPTTGFLVNHFIEEESQTVTTDISALTTHPVLAWSTCGVTVCDDKATHGIIGVGETAASGGGEASLTIAYTTNTGLIGEGRQVIFTHSADSNPTNLLASYIRGAPAELTIQKIEPYVASGTIASSVVTIIGKLS